MFGKFISLAAFVLLVSSLTGYMPATSRVSSADAGTPIIQVSPVQPMLSPAGIATVPAPTATAVPAMATLPSLWVLLTVTGIIAFLAACLAAIALLVLVLTHR